MYGWGLNVDDDALLLISELVTNAALHAPGPITVHLLADHPTRTLYCAVADTSPHLPQPRMARPDDEHGRGLLLLAAIAADHGWHRTSNGKITWFTQPLNPPGATTTEPPDR
jgi:anti-sigma regulatory factor (Ser/Thr protein kinase)